MSKVFRGLREAVCKADLLCSSSLLRVKGEPQHQTLLGGVVSVTLMTVLAALFYNRIIDTFNRVIITSSSSSANADVPTSLSLGALGDSPFMFGVQVWHHDLNGDRRYFDVTLTNTLYAYGEPQAASESFALEPCRRDHWEGFPRIQDDFDRLNISFWKCLPRNRSFELKGKYSSPSSKTLDVAVKRCTNDSAFDRPCASEAEIAQLFADNGGPMFFTIYFINPLINPDSDAFLSYYLEDSNYIAFSPLGGEESRLFVQDFEITTDLSIFPFADNTVQTGGIVSNSPLKSTYTQIIDTYAVFFFYKSPTSLTFQRSFQKIDEVFSYIGGLFGTILIVFFLISSYNTYKFEINMAGYLYAKQRDGEMIEKRYNFLYYIGQLIYSLLKSLNCKPNWQKLSYYYQTREQILKQLDVLYLFKRINFLEKSLSILFTDNQLKGLHLSNHITISQAINIRKNYKLKPKLRNQVQKAKRKDNNNCDKTTQQMQKSHLKKKVLPLQAQHEFDNFDSDRYSSSSDPSSDQQKPRMLQSIIELKKDCERNAISKKIWRNIDKRLKNLIHPIIIKQHPNQQIQAQIIQKGNQEERMVQAEVQSNQNLFLFIDPPIQERSQEKSQVEMNRDQTRELFSKLHAIQAQSSFGFHQQQ